MATFWRLIFSCRHILFCFASFFYCVIFCIYNQFVSCFVKFFILCHISLYIFISENTHTRMITSGVIITYYYDWCRVGNSIQFSAFVANTLTDCATAAAHTFVGTFVELACFFFITIKIFIYYQPFLFCFSEVKFIKIILNHTEKI